MRLPWRRQRDEELEEELRSHLAMAARDRLERGEPAADAGAAARREFGNVTLTKEVTREMWGWTWIERLAQDLVYGVRLARRTPGLTAMAVVSLALGIGANSAMFTLVESVLLRPLPYREPDRLVMVYAVGSFGPFQFRDGNFTEADYVEFGKLGLFEPVAAYATASASVTGDGEPIRIPRADVTANFFPLLGVKPALGRALLPSDDPNAATRAAVLSDSLWRSRYLADPRIVGKPTLIEGIPHVIVGVMPGGFNFPAKTEVWTPAAIRPTYRSNTTVKVIGRLAPGVSRGQALATLQTTLTNLARARASAAPERERVTVVDLREAIVGKARRLLLVLLGAVGCVLLIACTNIANLLMARAAARRGEMAIRTALGAGRARLARQLLTESVGLAVVGGACGLVIAVWTLPAALAWVPPDILPRADEIRIDRPALLFTITLCVLTGLLFGLAPALMSSKPAAIRPSAVRADSVAPADRRLRSVLIVGQIALVLVLLVAASLLLETFWNLQHVDPGFRADRVLTMGVSLPDRVYRTVEQKRDFYARLLDRLETMPEATDASAITFLPFGGQLVRGDFAIDGDSSRARTLMVAKPAVSERYFNAMGMPILRGRAFEKRDTDGAPPVAIVSEAIARVCWPGEDPIGKRLTMDDATKGRWLTVVGLVADVRHKDLAESPLPAIYVPIRQEWRGFFLGSASFLVRTAGAADAAATALREQVRALDPELPVDRVRFLDDRLADSIAAPRLRAGVVLAFAALALLLSLVGIHGVMSYEVVRRTAEIGIRRALGAPTGAVFWLVLGRTMRIVGLGVVAGLVAAAAATRVLETFLFAVEPFDLATFASVAAAVSATAMLASVWAARRAVRVDPLVALRAE